jgi:hypothetical protein
VDAISAMLLGRVRDPADTSQAVERVGKLREVRAARLENVALARFLALRSSDAGKPLTGVEEPNCRQTLNVAGRISAALQSAPCSKRRFQQA